MQVLTYTDIDLCICCIVQVLLVKVLLVQILSCASDGSLVQVLVALCKCCLVQMLSYAKDDTIHKAAAHRRS